METIEFIEKEIEYLKIKNAKARLKRFTEERIIAFVNVSTELRRYKLLLDKESKSPLENVLEKINPHLDNMLDSIKDMETTKITTPAEYLKKMEGVLSDKDLIEAIELKFKNEQVTFRKDYVLIILENTRATLDQENLILNTYCTIDDTERKNKLKWDNRRVSVYMNFNGIYYTEISLYF
jgi:hypothetical protein